ncbi:MAG: hypothetical protein ACYCSA_03925 [Thermoplasmataceae archaeon]
METRRKLLVIIPAVLFAFLVVGMAYNTPIALNSNVSAMTSVSSQSTYSTYNYSIRTIDELIMGLHPNFNFTAIYLQNSSLKNDSKGPEIISSGSILLNNTTYSYNLVVQHSNVTQVNLSLESLLLSNETKNYYNSGPPEDISTTTTVQTVFNITMVQYNTMVINGTNSKNSYNIFKKVTTDTVDLGPVYHQATSTVKKNTTSFSNFTEVKNGNVDLETFSIENDLLTANGNITSVDPNNSTTILSARFAGEIHNGSNNLPFVITIENNSGTLTVGGDPVNFSMDPQGASRQINGGTQWVGEAKTVLPYIYVGVPSIIATLAGLIGSIASLFGTVLSAVASAALGAIGIVGFFLVNIALFATSSDTIDPYAELSVWHSNIWYLSWIPEIEFELGAYSDRFHDPITGQTFTFAYSYNPVVSDLVSSDQLPYNYPFPYQHQSIYPDWSPYL